MKYDKSSAFGLLNGPFPCANIPSTTCFLQSVISPSTMKISDNIYRYCLRHCASGGPQLKGIDFYQSSSLFLSSSTLHRWELPGNYRDFIVVMLFYLFCRRTKIILVTPTTGFKTFTIIQSLMLFI